MTEFILVRKSGFLTLPRLVSGHRADFGQKLYYPYSYSFGRGFPPLPGMHIVPRVFRGGQRVVFGPHRNARFSFLKPSATAPEIPNFPYKWRTAVSISLFKENSGPALEGPALGHIDTKPQPIGASKTNT